MLDDNECSVCLNDPAVRESRVSPHVADRSRTGHRRDATLQCPACSAIDLSPRRPSATQISKMADQLFNLKLVAEIEKHPCLYNFNLPQYSRKDITEKAWSEVGEPFNLTGSECKERWKNLRAVFVRHLKPGSAQKSKPYYLAEAMQFTLPFVKTLHNTPTQTQQQTKHDSDHDESLLAPVNYERPSPCSSPTSGPTTLPSPQHSAYSWTKNTNKRSLEEDPDTNPNQYCKRPNLDSLDTQEEANKMFLLSLLPDMNLMSPSQTRKFKRRTMELIDDILEDVYIKPEQ